MFSGARAQSLCSEQLTHTVPAALDLRARFTPGAGAHGNPATTAQDGRMWACGLVGMRGEGSGSSTLRLLASSTPGQAQSQEGATKAGDTRPVPGGGQVL